MSFSANVNADEPQLLVMLMLAEVVAERSAKLLKILTNSNCDSWQFAKLTDTGHTISVLLKDAQPLKVRVMSITLDVSNKGTVCKEKQL